MSTGDKTSEVAAAAAASSSSAAPHEHPRGSGSVSGGGGGGASSSASSFLRSASLSLSLRHHNNSNAPKVEESDEEDLFTVPDVEEDDEENEQESTDSPKNTDLQLMTNGTTAAAKRRRGRNPVDRECRRLKRLLRNRVSAQQARERKKVYVNDMESRAKDLMELNSKLEEKISTLVNENTMLRKVLMNTRPKVDETIEPTKDLLR